MLQGVDVSWGCLSKKSQRKWPLRISKAAQWHLHCLWVAERLQWLMRCRVGQSEVWWEALFSGEVFLWAMALIVRWLLPQHPLQLTLMSEGGGVVTAHADFTSGSCSSYVDKWVRLELSDSFPKANISVRDNVPAAAAQISSLLSHTSSWRFSDWVSLTLVDQCANISQQGTV